MVCVGGFSYPFYVYKQPVLWGHKEMNTSQRTDRVRESLPICLSRSAASSGVARGSTPGSLKLALSSMPITKKNSTPPMAGMAGVRFDAKNGQLQWTKETNTSVVQNISDILLHSEVIITIDTVDRYST